MFRFFRAYGGHANDGDSLDVAYRYNTVEELERFLRNLGVPLVKFIRPPPQPEPGVAYSGDEFAKFPSLIMGTRWVQQPGHCVIADQKVFVWCDAGLVKMSVGQSYQITEQDVSAAELVEKRLHGCELERVDPPCDTKHYISPKYYPEYFG